jgi:hypothetical protein
MPWQARLWLGHLSSRFVASFFLVGACGPVFDGGMLKSLAPLLFVVSSMVSLLLALWGFQQEDGAVFSTSIYRALQLFTLQGGDVDGPVPWSLEVARWLAPATTFGGIYAAAYAFFGRWWGRMRLAWLVRDHVIVAGVGNKGLSLIRDLLDADAGLQVVAIDPVEIAEVEELRSLGVIFVRAEAGSEALFHQVRLEHAKALICMAGEDRTNIGVALAASACIPEWRRGRPVEIHVHVGDVDRHHVLQRNRLFDLQHDSRHRMRLFNCLVNRARRTWQVHPLECAPDGSLSDDVHLVIGQLTAAHKAMLVQAVQVGHFRRGGRVTVHVLSKNVNEEQARLLKEYPGIGDCARLRLVPLASADDFVDEVAKIASGLGASALLTVLGPPGDAAASLSDALLLCERFKGLGSGFQFRILLEVAAGDAVRLLVQEDSQLRQRVGFLPDMDEACGMEAVFNQSLDRVARRIHEVWKKGTDERIREAEVKGNSKDADAHRAKPAYRPWDELTEEQKDVNRLAADHLRIKVRAVGLAGLEGCQLAEAWRLLDGQAVDILCRMEHERWAAPYRLAGWKYGPRCDERRIHHNLVPYDDLNEDTKKYDLEQVMQVPNYLSGE